MGFVYKSDYTPPNARKTTALIRKQIMKMITAMARDVLAEALSNLRANGSYVTGKLAQSGSIEVTDAEMLVEVLFKAPYSGAVEFGSAPHWVPLGGSLKHKKGRGGKLRLVGTPHPKRQPLDFYAVRKFGSRDIRHCNWGKKYYGVHTVLGFEIWKAIGIGGTQPHPFFRPAIDLVESNRRKYENQYLK